MMERLIARGDEIARDAEARRVSQVAGQLRDLLGDAAVSAFEAHVLVEGRGLLQRWMSDPLLRFLRREYR